MNLEKLIQLFPESDVPFVPKYYNTFITGITYNTLQNNQPLRDRLLKEYVQHCIKAYKRSKEYKIRHLLNE